MNIAAVIKEQRKKQGLSQAQLAEAAGLSTAYISLLEREKQSPTLGSLEKISEVLKVPVPILTFLSLEKDDIDPERQEVYELIDPSIKALLERLLP